MWPELWVSCAFVAAAGCMTPFCWVHPTKTLVFSFTSMHSFYWRQYDLFRQFDIPKPGRQSRTCFSPNTWTTQTCNLPRRILALPTFKCFLNYRLGKMGKNHNSWKKSNKSDVYYILKFISFKSLQQENCDSLPLD